MTYLYLYLSISFPVELLGLSILKRCFIDGQQVSRLIASIADLDATFSTIGYILYIFSRYEISFCTFRDVNEMSEEIYRNILIVRLLRFLLD